MMMFGGGTALPGDPAPAGRGNGKAGGKANAKGGQPRPPADPPATEQLIADGWGYASINPTSIQADNGAGLTKGIIGLVSQEANFAKPTTSSLRAWGWGAARGLDYLETDKTVDAKKVGIEGVSRYGKAALVTMAYDVRLRSGSGRLVRWAKAISDCIAAGGAEAVENLTGSGEYRLEYGGQLPQLPKIPTASPGSKKSRRFAGGRFMSRSHLSCAAA